MLIADAVLRERGRQRFGVELRVRSRFRDLADIRDHADVRTTEQLKEGFQRAIGMADGAEGQRHVSGPLQHAALVSSDVVGLVALDFVLRVVR